MVTLKCNLMIGISISINIEMKTENLKIEGVNYLMANGCIADFPLLYYLLISFY